MRKTKLIAKYVREANNLNHNILFELDKAKNEAWNGPVNYKMVEYMRGQLSIIREVVHILRDNMEVSDIIEKLDLDYQLGDPIVK